MMTYDLNFQRRDGENMLRACYKSTMVQEYFLTEIAKHGLQLQGMT